MRYFSEKILRLRFAPLRMTHYFSGLQLLKLQFVELAYFGLVL